MGVSGIPLGLRTQLWSFYTLKGHSEQFYLSKSPASCSNLQVCLAINFRWHTEWEHATFEIVTELKAHSIFCEMLRFYDLGWVPQYFFSHMFNKAKKMSLKLKSLTTTLPLLNLWLMYWNSRASLQMQFRFLSQHFLVMKNWDCSEFPKRGKRWKHRPDFSFPI